MDNNLKYGDATHTIETIANGCKVTICFSKAKNETVERNVLDNLLDTFENRIRIQMNN